MEREDTIMTKRLWDFCEEKDLEKRNKVKMFLILHILIWCTIGATTWFVVSRVVLKDILWLFLLSGYAGVFLGMIGGAVYAMNRN